GPQRVITFEDGSEIAAHSIVLATGVFYRALEAEGCSDLTGRGIYYGSASTEAQATQGEDVYIVGGANSAGQAAVFFSRHARSVTLLVRGKDLGHSMSHYLIEQINAIDNITVRLRTTVLEAHGTEHLEGITLCEQDGGRTEQVTCGHVFVFIGAAPHTDWLDGTVAR
ncbi:NAD(P)/FAD-dependent oxidoreductase, partial [Actinomadura adrarensis]